MGVAGPLWLAVKSLTSRRHGRILARRDFWALVATAVLGTVSFVFESFGLFALMTLFFGAGRGPLRLGALLGLPSSSGLLGATLSPSLIITLVLVRMLATPVLNYSLQALGEKAADQMRVRLLDLATGLPAINAGAIPSGELSSIINEEVSRCGRALVAIVSSLQLFGGVALALTFLIARAPWVNLSAMAAAVPAVIVYIVLAARTAADTRSVVEARVRSASKVTEGLRSLSSIQATGGARELNQALRVSAEDMRARETRIFFNQGILQYAMALVPISAAVGAYLYARFGAGANTAQQFAAILMPTAVVGGRVAVATSGIVMNAYSTSVFATSFVPVFGLFERLTGLSRKDRHDPATAERTGDVVKAVHVKGCSFQLPNGVWLFRDLSLSLARGRPLVVRGPSGTGKSTLASLIAGTNEPTEGTIAYEFDDGGQSPPSPRHLNYLSQDPAVVAGTLRENLLLGMASAQADDAALRAALARVRLWDEFAAAGGLNAPVFEGGRNLSGGQIRRLGLARLVLRRKGLWIFDEATASLDPVSREIVQTFIREVAQREIVVAITHDEAFELTGAEIHLAGNSSARLVGAA